MDEVFTDNRNISCPFNVPLLSPPLPTRQPPARRLPSLSNRWSPGEAVGWRHPGTTLSAKAMHEAFLMAKGEGTSTRGFPLIRRYLEGEPPPPPSQQLPAEFRGKSCEPLKSRWFQLDPFHLGKPLPASFPNGCLVCFMASRNYLWGWKDF